MPQITILGRQPALGLAELESLLDPTVITPIGKTAALLDIEQGELPLDRIGGVLKAAKILTSLETTNWKDIDDYLRSSLPHHLQYIPDGKIKLGLSTYDLTTDINEINRTALSLKNVMKKHGRSARIISNKMTDLNTAQVIHGGLLTPVGIELLLIRDGVNTIVAQTYWVQDIDAYAERDQKRPKRDSKIGMLPPKLAQTIVNLATYNIDPQFGARVLDPFCGTGVILQEALLMGYEITGRDLDPRMVSYARDNLTWLAEKSATLPAHGSFDIKVADATKDDFGTFNIIACETYLGRPFSIAPDPQVLREVISTCNFIHKKFLRNLACQTDSGFRMCIAVPAWHTKSGFKHLPMLDSLEELGYNRLEFVYAKSSDLIYHRPDQVVARELVVLERT